MVARIKMKLGMYAYYIISTTITCYHDDRISFDSLKLLLHSSNLLTVARIEVKLGANVYYIVSMKTTYLCETGQAL